MCSAKKLQWMERSCHTRAPWINSRETEELQRTPVQTKCPEVKTSEIHHGAECAFIHFEWANASGDRTPHIYTYSFSKCFLSKVACKFGRIERNHQRTHLKGFLGVYFSLQFL